MKRHILRCKNLPAAYSTTDDADINHNTPTSAKLNISNQRTPRFLPATPKLSHNAATKIIPNLPSYIRINRIPTNNWRDMTNVDFIRNIDNAYNEIITWRKNIFKIPSGKAVKSFIKELTFWLEQFNNDMQLKGISLKVFMILPSSIAETI